MIGTTAGEILSIAAASATYAHPPNNRYRSLLSSIFASANEQFPSQKRQVRNSFPQKIAADAWKKKKKKRNGRRCLEEIENFASPSFLRPGQSLSASTSEASEQQLSSEIEIVERGNFCAKSKVTRRWKPQDRSRGTLGFNVQRSRFSRKKNRGEETRRKYSCPVRCVLLRTIFRTICNFYHFVYRAMAIIPRARRTIIANR